MQYRTTGSAPKIGLAGMVAATSNFVRDRIGEPSGVTTTKSATGTQEIWAYESVTIRFENSRVASVQDHGQ